MKIHIALLSTLSLSIGLLACGKSDSSNDTPAVVDVGTGGNDAGPGGSTTGVTGTDRPAPAAGPVGEHQDAIKLNSAFLEYSRLQYDCGDIAAPIDAALVQANLKGAKSFETLAATIPAKDQALVRISAEENGVQCTYRAIFAVNKSFSEVTYQSSQALNGDSFPSCGTSKANIDLGFGENAIAFEYDKKFIRWVALHIPEAMQLSPVCGTGKLRAVFAGAKL